MDWSFANSLSEKERMRLWVETWKLEGPELEAIKREELRRMTQEEATRRAVRVMNSRPRHARERGREQPSPGLIEQQRIFFEARPSPR